ncbi:unnamed protein product [Mytilus edulis]|uniref:DZIP3-like HEPN domain-containing protein n=1 Tax=Mytilus edulis TaxID=6550 RepID=A0A8S3UVS4_MYTED|nr:unnamed protein product [Mytilus edulis]
MDVLFPATGVPSSNNFDITLMMCVLKNLKQVPPQSLKMHVMPPSSDISEGADLVRLRLHRNTIGHIAGNTINTQIFTTMWTDLTQAVVRLGGSKYQQKCDEIRNMIFDTTIISNIQQEVQAFKHMLLDELSDMNQRVSDIEHQIDNQTTSDIHKVMIEQWEYDDRTFVHTNAIKHIMSLIENKQCILIKGNPGEYKDIETNYKAKAYQVFVCDDICGEYTIDRREVNRWSSQLTRDFLTTIFRRGKSKLLLSVKNLVFQESLFSELNYLKFALIDMSDEVSVTFDQKCTIAKQLLSMDDEAEGYVIDYGRQLNILHNIEFAPLTLTVENDDCNENIQLFYTDPIETYSKELNALNNAEDKSKLCALFFLIVHNVYYGLVQIVKYLLKISSEQLKDSQDKFPPLIAACERGHTSIVNLLIDYRPDMNQMDSFGRRPLIVAVQNDHPDVVAMLIDKGADINLGDTNGKTPFLWACILHRKKVAKLLMEHGADVNQASNDESTPLFWCSVMGFQSLLSFCMNKEQKDHFQFQIQMGKHHLWLHVISGNKK